MLKELLISSILFSPPLVRMYDVGDLLLSPPKFDNAPNFSISVGIMGNFPILTHHPYVRQRREKKKLEDIVYEFSEYHGYYEAKVYWYENMMIVKTIPEVHKILERH